jgi:hypothetical protein
MVDATAKNTVDTFNGMKKATLKEGLKNLIKQALQEEEEVYELYAEDELEESKYEEADKETDRRFILKLMDMYEANPSQYEKLHRDAEVMARTEKDIKYKHVLNLIIRAKAGALQRLADQDKFEADREGMDESVSLKDLLN